MIETVFLAFKNVSLHTISSITEKYMKKIIILAISLIMPLALAGQAQIDTKKVKISDFTQKVTKIVLNGNGFYDTALKDEVHDYEFLGTGRKPKHIGKYHVGQAQVLR